MYMQNHIPSKPEKRYEFYMSYLKRILHLYIYLINLFSSCLTDYKFKSYAEKSQRFNINIAQLILLILLNILFNIDKYLTPKMFIEIRGYYHSVLITSVQNY